MIDKPGINLTPILMKLQVTDGYRKGFYAMIWYGLIQLS